MNTGVGSLADGITKLLQVTAGAPQIMAQAEQKQQDAEADRQNILADTGYKNSQTQLNNQKHGFNQGYQDALPSMGPALKAYKLNPTPENIAAVFQTFANSNKMDQFKNIVPTVDDSLLQNQIVYQPDSLPDGGLERGLVINNTPRFKNTTAGTLDQISGETSLTDLARSAINENNAQAARARTPGQAGGADGFDATLSNSFNQGFKEVVIDPVTKKPMIDINGRALTQDNYEERQAFNLFVAQNQGKFKSIDEARMYYLLQKEQEQPVQPSSVSDIAKENLRKMRGGR